MKTDSQNALYENILVPYFFATLENEFGVVPQTEKAANTLLEIGNAQLAAYDKQAMEQKTKGDKLISKLASKLGLTSQGSDATVPEMPSGDELLKAAAAYVGGDFNQHLDEFVRTTGL